MAYGAGRSLDLAGARRAPHTRAPSGSGSNQAHVTAGEGGIHPASPKCGDEGNWVGVPRVRVGGKDDGVGIVIIKLVDSIGPKAATSGIHKKCKRISPVTCIASSQSLPYGPAHIPCDTPLAMMANLGVGESIQ